MSDRADLGRTAATIAAWMVSGALAVFAVVFYLRTGGVGYDAHAYWRAGRAVGAGGHPYALAEPGYKDAFLYSPAFAQVMRPLSAVPFPVFYGAWLTLEAAAFGWLTWPLRLRWRVPLLLLCVPELVFGNVYGFLGVAAALGVRRAGFWSFPVLTKVTSGGAGFVWFLVRGEWRALLRMVGWTVALTAVSYVLSPRLWHEYVHFLLHGHDSEPTWLRLARFAVALAVVAWGARAGRVWTVPVAMLLFAPHLSLRIKDVAMLAAIPRVVATARGTD